MTRTFKTSQRQIELRITRDQHYTSASISMTGTNYAQLAFAISHDHKSRVQQSRSGDWSLWIERTAFDIRAEDAKDIAAHLECDFIPNEAAP